MGVIFISHSSQNNPKAIRVRDWLRTEGWNEIFLDLDPSQGLAPGQRWQEELKKAGEHCSAVVVLVSPDWADSKWCQVEFLLADQLGKRIFPVLIEPTDFEKLPIELRGKFQMADISAPEKETDGFDRLAIGLKRAGLDPKSFDWPPASEPTRPVYRGLQALEAQDAAIFFGRDSAITRGLDELRRLRDGAPQRILVVLGASGAGKSSFLRAGLIARLERDEENFLVLPIVRPERAVLSGSQGFAVALEKACQKPIPVDDADAVVGAFNELRLPVVDRLRRTAAAARETYNTKPPTIILPIDQCEELFATENVEHVEFCVLLAEILKKDPNLLIVTTVRSDMYAPLQTETLLASAPQLLFSLPPLATGSFQDVIERPARLAKPPIAIEPELTQQLLADLTASDALPLLAFTLERLQVQAADSQALTLADYKDKLGGLAGAIKSAIDAALGKTTPEALAVARALFIPALVSVDAEGAKRRVALKSDVPAPARALATRLTEQRILVSSVQTTGGREVATLEVSHEAILRQWPPLAGWIAEEFEALRILDGLRGAAQEWRAHTEANSKKKSEGDGWLTHRGERLRAALRVAERTDFAALVTRGMQDYLTACRRAERKASGDQRGLEVLVFLSVFSFLAIGYLVLGGGDMIYRWWWYGRHVTEAQTILARGPGTTFQDCEQGTNYCPLMVVVGEGTFLMGSTSQDTDASPHEFPQHQVSIPQFAASENEITVGEWAICVEAHRCPEVDGGDYPNAPVVNVSWNDAHVYTNWLSAMTGLDYRLLSEAEWEYIARANRNDGPSDHYSWGNDEPVCYLNERNGAAFAGCNIGQALEGGYFPANRFGFHDLHGNVWEWIEDCYVDSYLEAPLNGAPRLRYVDSYLEAPLNGAPRLRSTTPCFSVVRGGSWFDPPTQLRSATRVAINPRNRNVNIGFRVARSTAGS